MRMARSGTVFAQLHHMGLQGLPAQRFAGQARVVAPSSLLIAGCGALPGILTETSPVF